MGEAGVGFKARLCACFGLERSSIYKPRVQAALHNELSEQIRVVLLIHPYYGHRRVADELQIGKNRARRVMRATGIPPPKRRKQYTKASNSSKPAPPNLLKEQQLVANYPHHIWAADFTYLWFQGRFYYLATVIDHYSRLVVGWSLGTHHNAELITSALMDAVSHYRPPAIAHNDRGSEYLSRHYQTICDSLEITPSASAPGSPWQNSFQESFYSNFKLELGDISRLGDPSRLFEAIALQLHYYTNRRIHSTLHTNPAAYAASFTEQKQQSTTEVGDKVMPKTGT
ncbi:MAG: IS3 family transposase [Candidatus Saccharimonadales bacterium]